MDNSAVEGHVPAIGKPGEAHTLTSGFAPESAPANISSTRAALDALGHPKHTRELFWRYWAPVLTMLALIALESTNLFSSSHSGRFLGALMRWLGHPLSPEMLGMVNHALRKIGHAVGYGLLCASWLLLLRGIYWLRHEYQICLQDRVQVRRLWWRPIWGTLAILCTAAVAVADELHQMTLASRTGQPQDMLLDISAALAAAAIVWNRARRRCGASFQSFLRTIEGPPS